MPMMTDAASEMIVRRDIMSSLFRLSTTQPGGQAYRDVCGVE